MMPMLDLALRLKNHLSNFSLLDDRKSYCYGKFLYSQWKKEFAASIPEMDILKCVLLPNDTVFDVGANIGEFTYFLSTIVDGNSIHAFEPQRKPYNILRGVCSAIKEVNLCRYALSSSFGDSYIFIPIVDGELSEPRASLDSNFNDFSGEERRPLSQGKVQELVRLTTIDDYCMRNSVHSLDFVKIDVEGHEFEVLKGGNRICLGLLRPIFLIEVFPYVYPNHFENIYSYMKSRDYSVFGLTKSLLSVEPVSHCNAHNTSGFNYFFVPREKISFFLSEIEANSK